MNESPFCPDLDYQCVPEVELHDELNSFNCVERKVEGAARN